MSVRVDTAAEDAEWDDLVLKSYEAPAEQTCAWAHTRTHLGWNSVRVKVYDNGVLFGGAHVLERTFRYGFRVGYAQNGPVFIHPSKRAISLVARALIETSHARRDFDPSIWGVCTWLQLRQRYAR